MCTKNYDLFINIGNPEGSVAAWHSEQSKVVNYNHISGLNLNSVL